MTGSQAETNFAADNLMPREKLERLGLDALTMQELLALILGTGYGGKRVLEAAAAVVRDYGELGLRDLKSLDLLREMTGMPFVKACQLLAGLELGRRVAGVGDRGELPRITHPGDVYPLTKDMWDLDQEQVRGVYLSACMKVLDIKVLTMGTARRSLYDPATVLKPALQLGATGIILVHNHPSGSAGPSDQDLACTLEIRQAAAIMNIRLIDHLIVTPSGYTSLVGSGLLTD